MEDTTMRLDHAKQLARTFWPKARIQGKAYTSDELWELRIALDREFSVEIWCEDRLLEPSAYVLKGDVPIAYFWHDPIEALMPEAQRRMDRYSTAV
jgi:hypothetical protein